MYLNVICALSPNLFGGFKNFGWLLVVKECLEFMFVIRVGFGITVGVLVY